MQLIVFRWLAAIILTSFFTLAHADSSRRSAQDVYVPPVTYPHNGTLWRHGQRHNVTWDTSNPPVNITNKIGLILLRKGGFTTPLILAQGFSILLGKVEVTVPWVLNGDDYQVVLFGDSGNFSPFFTILT